MRQQPKVMTIEDVEEAILQGQEQYHEVMADVLGQFYAPLVKFSEVLGGRNGQQLPYGVGQTGNGSVPSSGAAGQGSVYKPANSAPGRPAPDVSPAPQNQPGADGFP